MLEGSKTVFIEDVPSKVTLHGRWELSNVFPDKFLFQKTHSCVFDKKDSELANCLLCLQGIHQSVFMSAFVTSPTKDMPLCWEQHAKLLPGLDKISGSEVTDWTIHDVASFVKSLPGCADIGKFFLDEVSVSVICGMLQ